MTKTIDRADILRARLIAAICRRCQVTVGLGPNTRDARMGEPLELRPEALADIVLEAIRLEKE